MLASAKTALRTDAPGPANLAKMTLKGRPSSSTSPESMFREIYASGTWGEGDAPNSGSSSDDSVSAPFVGVVCRLIVDRGIVDKGIESVVDLGCGGYRVGGKLADLPIDDTGVYLENAPFNVQNAKVIATTPLPPLLRNGRHLTIYMIDRAGAV